MSRTFLRQDTQIRQSDLFDGSLTPGSTLESGSASLEGDLNSLRSQVYSLLKKQTGGNWYDALTSPSIFPGEGNATRAVDNLNSDLHELERKRVLVAAQNLNDVTVTAAQNWQVLTIGQLPAQTIAAVGVVTTIGTVAANNATFGAHSLDLVAGSNVLSPKNLCEVEDSVTHDPILSGGRTVFALFQTESATDGSTMTGTTPNRAQLSFVRINVGGTALEAVPSVDIAGLTIHYSSTQRKALEDLNEQDFLKGAIVDTPASVTVTRQTAYDGQGATAVEVVTNSTLDLNSAGVFWELRDLVNATLLRLTEGSTGGTTALQVGADVDTFDVNAIVNDFAAGLKVRTGGQEIKIGVTDGVIESTATNNLRLSAAGGILHLDDSFQTASTWVGTDGVSLASSSAEWTLYKTNYGEVSLLNAINQAITAGITRATKVYSNVTTDILADTNAGGVGGGANLDAQLQDFTVGAFIADNDVYLNGSLLRGGADAAANNDYYPGTSLATGQLKFEFKLKTGDVLSVISWR